MFGKIRILILCCVVVIISGGCVLSELFSVESPRPKEYQVEASKEITTSTVTEVMKGQTGKQTGIQKLATEAIKAIKESETQFQVAGITNVVANASNDIRKADGSAKLLSQLSGASSKSISEMSALEYMTYAGAQSALAMQNRDKAAKGIKAGFEWTKGAVATYVTGGVGALGLIGTFVSRLKSGGKVKSKDGLLKATGNTVNEFTAKYPTEGAILKTMLAKATANIPVNANEEFGV